MHSNDNPYSFANQLQYANLMAANERRKQRVFKATDGHWVYCLASHVNPSDCVCVRIRATRVNAADNNN